MSPTAPTPKREEQMSGRRLWTRYLVAVALAFGFYSSSAFADEKKPLIISFNGPAGEAYIGKFIKGIKATASDNGYDIGSLREPV
jgi:ABC-type sugar transport system substrate-binding protein